MALAAPAPVPGPRKGGDPSRAWLALLWLAGFQCRAPLIATGPLLPLIIADLHLSRTVASSLTAIPLLAMALLSIPGGMLSDRWGARRVLAAAVWCATLGGALRAWANGAAPLVLAVSALGVGISLAQPALSKAAHDLGSGRVTSVTAVYANGMVSGGLLASLLTAPVLLPLAGGLSWRGALLAWALPGVVAGAGLSLAAGRREAPRGSPSPAAAAGEGAGVPAGEGGAGALLARLAEVWRLPGVPAVAVAFAAQSLIFYALVSWLPTFYVELGWPIAAASTPVMAVTFWSLMGTVLGPLLVRGVGLQSALLMGSAVALAGQAGLLALPRLGVLWASLLGAGTNVVFTLGLAAPALLAPGQRVGAAAGVVLTLGYVGAFLGPVLVGALRDLTGGFTAGWVLLLGVALAMAGAAASLVRVPRHRPA